MASFTCLLYSLNKLLLIYSGITKRLTRISLHTCAEYVESVSYSNISSFIMDMYMVKTTHSSAGCATSDSNKSFVWGSMHWYMQKRTCLNQLLRYCKNKNCLAVLVCEKCNKQLWCKRNPLQQVTGPIFIGSFIYRLVCAPTLKFFTRDLHFDVTFTYYERQNDTQKRDVIFITSKSQQQIHHYHQENDVEAMSPWQENVTAQWPHYNTSFYNTLMTFFLHHFFVFVNII